MRTCEERIIHIEAASAEEAYDIAQGKGKSAKFRYKNDEGNPVFFEFVEIKELLCLGSECGSDEYWYDTKTYLLPMEQKHKHIPPKKQLNAIRIGD